MLIITNCSLECFESKSVKQPIYALIRKKTDELSYVTKPRLSKKSGVTFDVSSSKQTLQNRVI